MTKYKKLINTLDTFPANTYKIVCAVSLFYFILLILLAWCYQFNLSAFINIGRDPTSYTNEYNTKEYLYDDIVIFDGIPGYDGSQYFFMAHDPLLLKKNYMTSFRKRHFFRYQKRILYPLIAFIISFGQPRLIPFALLLINGIAVAMGTFVLCKLLILLESDTRLSLVFSISAGMIFSFFYNLTEPFGYCLIVTGLYYYEKKNVVAASIWLAISLLARESSVLVIWGILIIELVRREYKNCLYISLSILPSIIYQKLMTARLNSLHLLRQDNQTQNLINELYFAIVDGAVGIPFKGIYMAVIHNSYLDNPVRFIRSGINVCAIVFIIICFIKQFRINNYYKKNVLLPQLPKL